MGEGVGGTGAKARWCCVASGPGDPLAAAENLEVCGVLSLGLTKFTKSK